MPPFLMPSPPTAQPQFALTIQAFTAGLLVMLGCISVLANRALRDPLLKKAGFFGLLAAATWITFSDIGASLLPGWLIPALRPTSLLLAGATLALWERITTDLLAGSPSAQPLARARRFTAVGAALIAFGALVPLEPAYRLSRLLFGLLAFLLAILTIQAALRANRDGLGSAKAVAAAGLALLVRSVSLGAVEAGWIHRATGMIILQVAILTFVLAIGWVMLGRMRDLRRDTDVAQAAQLAAATRQAQELEGLVQVRNAELSERIKDLNEARQSTEQANQSLQRALEELEQAASTDRLTGAWNRRRFEEMAHSELALARRRLDPLALIMIDLDHSKRVNDTFGHGAGDAVLAGMAQAVRQCLRVSDALVRWGGEEFLVMAPATHLEGALGLAEKLRLAVAAIDFPEVGHVTMSLGVSEYAPGEALEAWIDRTDQALYRAKSSGRNQVASAAPSKVSEVGSASEPSLLELAWEEAYTSGVTLIDAQHQKLFRLANLLLSVITGRRPVAEVSLRLETLLAHTAQHFHDEEALLREARYPNLSEHAGLHASLLNQARKLQADVQAGQLDFGGLISFLALDLIKGHILTEDRHYFTHLRVEAEPESGPPPGI